MSRLRAVTFGLSVLVFVANFLTVQWIWGIGVMGQTLIPGLVDFSPAFNRGVSFGLFAQDSVAGCYLLIALLVVIIVAVAVMAWRTAAPFASIGFGLILGGALGNLWDRVLRCAVFDFFSVHLGSVPLFVCNFADLAISVGVIFLLADSFFAKRGARNFAD